MTKLAELMPEEMTEQELEVQLPIPVGYRLLVAMPEIEETYENTKILKTSTTMHQEHVMSIIGLVLDMGDQAYSDKERFGDKPWCKPGDWVLIGRYSGSRIQIEGGEIKLLNDDEIIATVPDPEAILHQF